MAAATAQDAAELPPCENCADSITIVSWGGAYQAMQQNAWVGPYAAAADVDIVWDESSAEAAAKLRAQNEAGNVTWDVVDVLATDGIRLCDEGLVAEIPYDEWLAPAPDGTPASEDLGKNLVSDCHIPTNLYSTTFGYRTDVAEWEGRVPEDICAVFDLENFPGKRALEKRPINNLEWALICDGRAGRPGLRRPRHGRGGATGVRQARHHQGPGRLVVGGRRDAAAPRRRRGGDGSTYNGRLFSVIEEQDQPVAMLWDYEVLDIDGWVVPVDLPEDRLNRVKHFLRFVTDTQRLADVTKYISYGPGRASSRPLVTTHAELGVEMAPHMPTAPENAETGFLFNYEWWADKRDELDSRFQSWLAQ